MIVLPEPCHWHEAFSDKHIFAPWTLSPRWPRISGFITRRQLPGVHSLPGYALLDAGTAAWAGGRAERLFQRRFFLRRLVDRLAASRPNARVVAPSLAAKRSFAAAKRRGAHCVLVEDLPDLRGLHEDLDRAAMRYPKCPFLENHRAPACWIARQEVERTLADEIWVRGEYAWQQRIASGVPASKLRRLSPPPVHALAPGPDTGRVRLAGLATGRNGSNEALALVEALDHIELLITPGAGSEPAELISHPRVRPDDGGPVDVVIAPAWCETYRHELRAAVAADVPVIATGRAAGFLAVQEVPVGDASALVSRVAAATLQV